MTGSPPHLAYALLPTDARVASANATGLRSQVGRVYRRSQSVNMLRCMVVELLVQATAVFAPTVPAPSPSQTTSPSPTVTPTPSTGDVITVADPALIWWALGLFTAALAMALILATINTVMPRRLIRRLSAASSPLLDKLSPADISDLVRRGARSTNGVTRTTLALVGFALLGLSTIIVFAASGPGTRDLRSALVGAIATLVASISSFYFATRATESGRPSTRPTDGTPPPVVRDEATTAPPPVVRDEATTAPPPVVRDEATTAPPPVVRDEGGTTLPPATI
jgi:hypothetical protein